MYLCTSKSLWLSFHKFFGIYLNFSTRKIPSPPLPVLGLQMKVNLGCSSMYFSSSSDSSGSWKLIGAKLNSFWKVFLIRFEIAQKTFLRARYSAKGYLFHQNLFFPHLFISFWFKASANQYKLPPMLVSLNSSVYITCYKVSSSLLQ